MCGLKQFFFYSMATKLHTVQEILYVGVHYLFFFFHKSISSTPLYLYLL